MTPRMFSMPTWGLFFGSAGCRWPSEDGGRAGAARDLVPSAFDAFENLQAAVRQDGQFVHAEEDVRDLESFGQALEGDARAARGGFQPPKRSNRLRSSPGSVAITPASAAGFGRLGEAAGQASRARKSNGTFCATVIITCCSFALGPRLTSVTLLPGCNLARLAAS